MNEHSRAALWQNLTARETADVVVIGAGINGVSVYRELALQGVDVVLVDQGDFCGAASAAPSRMIHGGLRYLETGETALVRESLAERNALLHNAPHYVRPLPTTIPIFYWLAGVGAALLRLFGREPGPSRRGALIIKAGLWLYDFYTRRRQILPRHRFRSRKATLQQWPALNNELVCSATYYDAWISYPERLALEMVLDTQAKSPQALALNYVALSGSEGDQLTLTDRLSGQSTTLKPRIVINASGAWIDHTNEALNSASDFIGGTKGSHLIVDNDELRAATGEHMIFYETPDGRVCILFPFMGKVLVGSTDLPVDSPDEPYCTPDEEAYILESLAYVFPHIRIEPQQILYRFSGIRPLPRSDAAVTGQISRNHQCRFSPATEQRPYPILSMVGGKWTTFRAFGEQVADRVLKQLQRERSVTTANLAIGGGCDYPTSSRARQNLLADWQQRYAQSPARLAQLFDRYGTRAETVLDFLAAGDDSPLHSLNDYSEREIVFLIEFEAAHTLLDLVLRRTSIGISGRITAAVLLELQTLLARHRQLSDADSAAMLTYTRDQLRRLHGLADWQLNPAERNSRSA
ncbi:glycerol-3-phosphate dehydrogenase/oxidase [Saccharospirillum mangrovi]|uniref:glycerol-3-phosphate dehydrogenase/oxidase n=1 Tax=Saccharospirillum mangrovi TaxID=2161747 RepID=UPI000D342F6C|nr:glycerol-3-phosphate dehydrogenase/oxidase [Saccharospirillum mangrovi]